jgi:hypothetical protein
MQFNRQSGDIGGALLISNGRNILSNSSAIAGSLPDLNLQFYSVNRFISYFSLGTSISTTANELYTKAIERYNYKMNRLGTYNIIIEGHSFAVTNILTNPLRDALKTNNVINPYQLVSIGVGGSTMDNVTSRISNLNSYKKTNSAIPFKNIIALWIGTNAAFSVAEYNKMKTYINDRYADGYEHIYCFTATPRTLAPVNESARIIFNDLMRTELEPLSYCTVVDTDTAVELTDASNTTYFSDGLHLTTAGNAIAAQLLVYKLEANI